MRVNENGLRLARVNGANQKIVTLFAFTHDMARTNEGSDYKHGPNAAQRIKEELLGREFFTLTEPELDLLLYAVEEHTNGLLMADITVQTCWDADRLDLNRVGIQPARYKLCTPQARDPEVLEWANKRAAARTER
jgi:uncharacterized protein